MNHQRHGLKDIARSRTLRTTVFTAIALVVVIITGAFVVLVLGISGLNNTATRARRSDETLQTANASERSLVDLETGVRGYLLTGERVFLGPYVQARASIGPELTHLVTLAENPTQQMRARGIASAVASYERSYADPLAHGSGRLARPRDVTVTFAGKRALDAIRGRFELFDRTAQLHADRQRVATASSAHVALTAAGGAFTLLVLVLVALAAYLARAVLAPIRSTAKAAKRLGEGDLGTTVPERGIGEVGELARAFNSMARLLQERDRALQVTNDRFQGLLDNANAAIFIKEPAGRYLLVNREFERIHSAKAQDAIGHDDFEITSADLAEQRADEDHQVIAAGGPISFEQHVRLPEGPRTFLVVKFPVRNEAGIAIAGISTDITAQKYALAQALEASRLQSSFVANMSHEIRTPLNGVVGMTHLLHETSLDAVQQGYTDALAASSEALLSIVNDVLDFSKIDAGQLELDPTDFDLRDAVEEACLMLAGQADAADLKLIQGVDADLPTTVNGDRGRLRQILLNLLSNSIKFTPSGQVAVRVLGDKGDVVRFEVSDTGIGIDSDQAAHLFDAFVQADRSTTRQHGGTGLGLTISRELVHQMGGEIGVEVGQGSGSVFWFSVKLPAVATSGNPVRSRPELFGLRALIVEDDVASRTVGDSYLKSWGLACESVEESSAAIEVLERASRSGKPFAVAVVDFDLRQINGIELVRAIRERPALGALRIVLLSASPLSQEALAGVEVSAALAKPIRRSQLFNAIGDAIAGVPPQREPASPVTSRALSKRPLVLIAEDNEINRAVAKALLEKQGLQVTVAHNGREAVEMALANDYAAIFMDCQMPELDGYEATRRIRAAENDRRVPIIAMTAHSMRGDRERCLGAGMDDYISKPVRTAELATIVTRWLFSREAAHELQGTHGHQTAGRDSRLTEVDDMLDRATIVQLRETLTSDMRQELVEAFEQSLPKCVADIEAAGRSGDQLELRHAAHLLKGTSATLGAARLRLSCQQLEHSGRGQDPSVSEEQLVQLRVTANEARQAVREGLCGSGQVIGRIPAPA
jgi:two-component system, sensor histidine kinase and response regulator